MSQVTVGLDVVRAQSDADLEVIIAVRSIADPDGRPPRLENLRHSLDSNDVLVYVVARLDGEPAGCGFVEPLPEDFAPAHCIVVPALRRRGIGSAILAELGAAARGRPALQTFVAVGDSESRAFLERRGYEVVGGERAVTLELDAYRTESVTVPPGVDIVALAERPDLVEALYEVGTEAVQDIPGCEEQLTFAQWRSLEIDRPTIRHDLFLIALANGEPVAYASLDGMGDEGRNFLTAVRRSWRRRGIATVLKRRQIEAARAAGLRRLITQSEERNLPMSSLNAKLGYLPDPVRSTLTMRGPTNVRLPHAEC